MSAERPPHGDTTTTERSPQPDEAGEGATPSQPAQQQQPAQGSDARYATQAAAAKPAPVAFEGGAGEPGMGGGTTPHREWVFLVLAVFFALAFISVPAVLFTSLDLTAVAGSEQPAPEGSDAAREVERRQVLQETRADALSKLYTYGPTEDGAFRIPVEEAMRLTLQEDYQAATSTEAAGSELPLAIPGGAAPAAPR